MNVRTITLSNISSEDRQKWSDLAARAVSRNPLSEPECVLAAVEHLRNGAKISLLVAEQDGRFDACIPLQVVRRWRSMPRSAYSTRIRRMTWNATPLVDSERGEIAIHALLSDLAARGSRRGPSFVVFEWLNETGPVGDYIRSAARSLNLPLRVYDSWEQPFVTRRPEATYGSIHSKKTLANRDRKLRALGRELGGEPRIVDRGSELSGANAFVQLEGSGYKVAAGVAMTTQPGESEWFTGMADNFAKEGRFHALALEVGDTTVAMECLIRCGEGLSMVKWSYDERFEKYSPGAHLHFSTLNWFHNETDASWLDICTYKDNHFALGEYPEHRSVSTLVVSLRGQRDARWLKMLALDHAFRGVIFKVGERLKINGATLSLLCDGGDYGRLSWKRTK